MRPTVTFAGCLVPRGARSAAFEESLLHMDDRNAVFADSLNRSHAGRRGLQTASVTMTPQCIMPPAPRIQCRSFGLRKLHQRKGAGNKPMPTVWHVCVAVATILLTRVFLGEENLVDSLQRLMVLSPHKKYEVP